MSLTTNGSVLYSTSYTSGVQQISEEFGASKTVVTLGLTVYLVGLAIGSMFTAPLSEIYGRKPVCVICLALFTILIIPCALAQSVTTLLVVRFFGAFFGSVMISTAPGMVADLVDDEHRALAFSIWSIGPLNGPGQYPRSFPTPSWTMSLTQKSSLGTRHRWIRDAVSGLALDVLDRAHSLLRGAWLRHDSPRNICTHTAAEKGGAAAQRNG